MKFCNSCGSFISLTKDLCPLCGSAELRTLSFPYNESGTEAGTSLNGKKIVFKNKKYKIGEILGLGGYGMILAVAEENSTETYAMKVPISIEQYFGQVSIFSLREIESSEKSIEDEISAIGKLKTERIIKVKGMGRAHCDGTKLNKDFPAILMELAVCTLRDVILLEESGKIEISLAEKLKMTSRIILTISDLHNCGIIHRDIALENIFVVDRNGMIEYVMADFGTSRERTKKDNEKTTGIVGRDKYLDPLRFDKRYRRDPRVDIFTAGIVITEIFIGNLWDNIIYEPLYELDFEREFLRSYAAGRIDKRLVKFISKAIKTDISKRYINAAEMENKFKITVSRIVRSMGNKQIIRNVGLVYNIPVPLESGDPGEDVLINFESHNKINVDVKNKTILKFCNDGISAVYLKGTPFFKTFCENGNIYIVPDRKKIERRFRFFNKKKFAGDRGILYFTGQLRIKIRSRLFDTVMGEING